MNILRYIFNWKYRLFIKKIWDVRQSIAEFEFKVAKSRGLRESVRLERDRAIEALQVVENKLKLHMGMTAENFTQSNEMLEKEKAGLTNQVQRFEVQMKMIDEQINGIVANGENEGQMGILDTIQGLVELKGMYKSYLQQL